MIGRFGILVLFALMLTALPAGAELRQWTDGNGVKHFSNKEDLPEGVSVERSFEERESSSEERLPYRKTTPATPSKQRTHQVYQSPSKPDEATILKEIRIREARLDRGCDESDR